MTLETSAQRFIFGLTASVAVIVVAACVWGLAADPGTFAGRKDQFEITVTQTLLPMFIATAASLVTTMLGQAVRATFKRA